MSDFATSRYVRARKTHTCAECRLPIESGTTYLRVAGATDGYGWSAALCLRCDRLHEAATDCARARGYTDDDGPTIGGAVEWILESGEQPEMDAATEGHFWGIAVRRREKVR